MEPLKENLKSSYYTEEYDKITENHPWYKKITKLDLCGAKIEKIPESLRYMHSLIKLDLSDTRITEIKSGIFTNLPKLKELNLSWNESLTTLHAKAFHNLPSLEKIDLSSTILTEINDGVFVNLPNLKELYISTNSQCLAVGLTLH